MKIPRAILPHIVSQLNSSNKGVIILGARQTGKTTMVNDIINKLGINALVINADQRGSWWNMLISREITKIKLLISSYNSIFIDEAQRIPEIGLILKIILDNFPNLKVIVTGSSSLDLASKVSEPLTGRAYSYKLYPISLLELSEKHTHFELESSLEERLLYGSYPEIFSIEGIGEKIKYLDNLINSYLYRDLLEFGDIRNSSKIRDLLKLLAFQIGSQVSLTELGTSLELNKATVDRYIDLLEKSFIIFRLSGFSRNLRKEVTKMDKIYFYDNGVRNAIIGNLNSLKDRDDGGKLWENFLISERVKKKSYTTPLFSHYFWRLTSGSELDFVEEEGGALSGYEFKFSYKVAKAPKTWLRTYPKSSFSTVNRENYRDFTG